ncbi:hypothetical protein EKO23_23305 [Nocardioides guangzhouensis]|uniref:Uncharacterized protein n=1 Tax=Nocardioides guangzhouensis TaxID=2497878 RepID=A0A4Q4Z262_9ACTN|nr:hypothetical protein [Nocardioides guangzhouensis]RYP81612.1 hypothetical protein EKO23_23305 [Nocardioides guangzhouensis]
MMWAVDSFAATAPGIVHHVDDLPAEHYRESFHFINSLVSPWHQWLDPVRYGAHVDRVERLRPTVVASAHGPVLTGQAIHDAFDMVREMAGQPIVPRPGQSVLDELLAMVLQRD